MQPAGESVIRARGVTKRFGARVAVRDLGLDAYTKRGLHAPPTELIFLHRKLAGTYLLLAHIGAKVDCGRVFREFGS